MQDDEGVTDAFLRLTARGILFDMDGTLVDSTRVVEKVWTEFALSFGLDPAEVLAVSHGRQAIETIVRFAPADADIVALTADLTTKEMMLTDGVVAVAGAREFLLSLPSSLIGLVTSAPRDLALARMAATGLPVPDVVVFGEDVAPGKPDPAPFLHGAHLLGIGADQLLVFEDSPAGIRAGLASGARVVVVGAAGGTVAEGLPHVPDYEQLRAVVEIDDDGNRSVSVDRAEYRQQA